jgi:hypothetical protein
MDKNRYLRASEAPGVLDGWCGPVRVLDWRGVWAEVIWWEECLQPERHRGIEDETERIFLDTNRPEVRDHLVRYGADRMHALHTAKAKAAGAVAIDAIAGVRVDAHWWNALRNHPGEVLLAIRVVLASSHE